MPANTPIYNFPYPLGTDPVAQGDNIIRELAEDVETVLASSVPGLVKIATVNVPGSSSLVVVDNIFTSAFRHYKVVLDLYAFNPFFPDQNNLYLRFINDDGTYQTSSYLSGIYGRQFAASGVATEDVANSVVKMLLGRMSSDSSTPNSAEFTIFGPRQNIEKRISGQWVGDRSTYFRVAGEMYGVNTSLNLFRGFILGNDENWPMTGEVSIYGYN